MIPERELNPPEDKRRAVYYCEICEEPIYVGEDYYDIPGLGICCTECISDAKKYCAEEPCHDEDYE